MAMPRKIPIDFGVVFPFGAFAVGEVNPVKDYDKSTRDNIRQAIDPDTGLLIWSIDVVDGDPEARKANRTVSVKIPARVQPVLPKTLDGLPFTPIELIGLTATAYIEENGDFSKISWSFRANGLQEPGSKPRTTPEKAA